MKHTLVIIIFLLTVLSCGTKKNKLNNSSFTEISESKRALDSIITVAKKQSLYSKNVNWNILEKEVYNQFIESDSINSIIKPVQFLLNQLGDYHGFLFLNGQRYNGNVMVSRNVPYEYNTRTYYDNMSSIYQKTVKQDSIKAFMVDNNIAYLEIPLIMPNGGDENEIIKNTIKIRTEICKLKTKNPVGWIIDLRGNLGGNMYPMLMGLAEILPLELKMGGDSKDGKSILQEWSLKGGVFYYGEGHYSNIPKLSCHSQEEKPKIAVLIGRYTASSGEAVACGLKNQENIKLFGEQTSGATTANNWIPIGKDIVFNPAVSYYASVNKTIFKDGILPDVEIIENFDIENPTQGKVFSESIKWIKTGYNNVYKK